MSSYIPIASQTLGSSASSVTFSSIPTTLDGKTLRDLVLVCDVKPSMGQLRLEFNSNTSNYSGVYAYGSGGSTSSGTYGDSLITAWNVFEAATTANIQILDYAQTNKHKSYLVRADNGGSQGTIMSAHRWGNTAAITSLAVFLQGNDLVAGSTFSLFGLEG